MSAPTVSWKPVLGYEDKYAISSDGVVKRIPHVCLIKNRWGAFSERPMPEMILKPAIRKGYAGVGLWRDGKCKIVRISVLVCSTFNGSKPHQDAIVLHNDGDTSNNSYNNLRWGTGLENARDRELHGRTARGVRQHSAKLNDIYVAEIREQHDSGASIRSLARAAGVAQTTILRVIRGDTWTHVARVPRSSVFSRSA